MSETSKGRSRGRRFGTVVASVVTGAALFAAGLAGGFVAAAQKSAPADAHGHGHGGGHDHGGGDDGHDHAPHAAALSPRTLQNLGVEVAELAPSEFVRTRDVPGVVVARPGSLLPVSSPVGGTLEAVLVVEGQQVLAGDPVARLRRDAFPRPSLVLTDAVLRPLNEELHSAVAELRSSSEALAIAGEELARVRRAVTSAGAEGALPVKVEMDLRNEERRARRALENARHEAERHGLTAEEIAGIEAGGDVPTGLPPAERVLVRAGLWSEQASAVLALLPEDARRLPYAAAILGELVGARALSPRLVEAIRSRPPLAVAFLDLAGLVQQGWSVESLVALADAGALEPVLTLRAPAGAPDWDVESVRTRPGERVEAGTAIVECRDLSTVHLELALAGPDLAAVAAALGANESVSAEPLLAAAGPALKGLRLQRFDASGGARGGGTAVVPVENHALCVEKGSEECAFRSWSLRPGMRYLARIPVERSAGRFVLPADAVAPQGPDTVLLLEDGKGFRPVPVRVEHRDARVVVVANDGAVFPGDRVVMKGAYAVLLATQASTGAVDAGCGHHH